MAHDTLSTEAYYDDTAASYDEMSYTESGPYYPANAYRLELTKTIAADLPRGRVLDAGCGTGLLLSWLRDEGFDVAGCDLSAGMLAQARRKLPDIELV